MYCFLALFCSLFLLSGCSEEDEILKQLKEINIRHEHQYRMQLAFRKDDEELQNAFTSQEKREILEYRKREREERIKYSKESILEHLRELKNINKRNFTGKIFTNIRAYALERSEEESFLKIIFIKLPLLLLTSSKYDEDIALFQLHSDLILLERLTILELENFPYYVDPAFENSKRKTGPLISDSMALNNKTIDKLIKEYS